MPMTKQDLPIMDGSKTCFCCGESKHVTAFHAHKRMKDGRLNKCAVCVKKAVDQWRLDNPTARVTEHARVREKQGFKTRDQWVADVKANAKGKKVTALEWYRRNRESVSDYRKQYATLNKDKISARNKAWSARKRADRDPAYYASKLCAQRKREAAKLTAIPNWSDEFVTKGMYELSAVFRRVGLDMQVDHIVPLQGKNVSGLHWHGNMQLMIGKANSSKHNRAWPDMP